MQTPEDKRGVLKNFLKITGLFLMIFGLSTSIYIFFPLIYWQLVFAPNFSQQNADYIQNNNSLVSEKSIQNLFSSATQNNPLNKNSSLDAKNWFPEIKYEKTTKTEIKSYYISIPKINIYNATVSTTDTDLSKHLINFSGTVYPPQKGNAVIFGHSSLPQLYNPKNYKTIFTYIYKLKRGDEIIITINNKSYKYKIEDLVLTDPQDTQVLFQNYSNSYLTLVTCAPPGTVWKRLVVRATIENI